MRYCNCGQQSVGLSSSGGRPQRLQRWGSSRWLVIFLCSLNPFTCSLSLSRFIQNETFVQPVLTSLKHLDGELHKTGVKMGGRIADNQSTAAQQHCFPLEVFLAGPYRSTLPDRMFTCATCHYIAHILSCVSITKLQNRGWNVSPRTLAPPKLFPYVPAWNNVIQNK